jgi:hypothetical protein
VGGAAIFSVLLGFAFFAAFWVASNPGAGLGPFAIMVAHGVLLLVGGRSEILRGPRGQPADECYRMFDLRASAITGTVTLSILTGGFFYELAQGHSGNPYGLVLGAAGVTYLAALLVLRWRS